MSILISEIGMCHQGSIVTAKEMIRISRECGATHVKGQAFVAEDVKGSMPTGFYNANQISLLGLVELIQYGEEIGIPVFYSIFSKEYEPLRKVQKWQKFSASQSKTNPRLVECFDSPTTFVSVNLFTMYPKLKKAQILYASKYLTSQPDLSAIEFLAEFFGRRIGYSDHTEGVDWCLKAFEQYGADVIEKHFTLTRDIFFEGQQFRDAIHGALPEELTRLAKGMGF